MKKTFVFLIVLVFNLTFKLFAAGEQEIPAPDYGVQTGLRFQFNLEPGSSYSRDMQAFIFKYTVQPQVAIWLETPGGSYIDTLYVTQAVARQDFKASPREGRPEALPVWTHLNRAAVDSVTSATTKSETVRFGNELAAQLSPGIYVVKLETNRSYDWNETYTKDNSGVNGQPSVIYSAELKVGGGRQTAAFIPFGTGAVNGSDGAVRPGLEGIDSALQLFSGMTVSYEPE